MKVYYYVRRCIYHASSDIKNIVMMMEYYLTIRQLLKLIRLSCR